MKRLCVLICLITAFATSALAGVTVSSPKSGATVGSPVSFVATATSATCSRGVASMGIYVNDKLVYVVNGASINTKLSLGSGTYMTEVQEWDNCGGATNVDVPIKVAAESGVWVTSPARSEERRVGKEC